MLLRRHDLDGHDGLEELRLRTPHRLLEVDRRDVLLGDLAADDLVHELVTRRRERLHVDHRVAVLAAAAGLADELALDAVDGLADRLAVGDLRAADVRVDVELALEAVDDDLEVQLAHPGDERLPRLLVGPDTERRVFLRETLEALAELVLVALRLRLDRNRDHRLRELHRLEL